MSKRAVLYARVSTEDQADKGFSLPSQLAACRQYATAHGLEVVAEFAEDVSGRVPLGEREQGRRLAQMLERREADGVIAHAVDRLSRDDLDVRYMVRVWRRAGIEVHTGDVGRIETENDIVLVIKGWQSADELAKIRERTMRGRMEKARSGQVVSGNPPYGYQHTRDAKGRIDNFAIVEAEAAIVRQIYAWYTVGNGTGVKLAATAIARRLSELGVPTPGEVRDGYKRKRAAGMWQPDKVLRILANEAYAGKWRYNVRIGRTWNTHPPEEQVVVDVPPIIDQGTWEAAKAQRAHNKRNAKRNAKRDYLLSGMLRCACGAAMCGQFLSNQRYYSCGWHNNHHVGLEQRHCWAPRVRAEAVEADVWGSLKGVFSDLARLEELLYQAQRDELAALEPQRAELEMVKTMLAECEQQAADIARAIIKAAGIVGQALEQQAQAVNRRYEALAQRQADLLVTLAQTRITDEAIRDAVRLAADVRAGLENADWSTRRWVLELFQVEVTVKEGWFYVSGLAGEWGGLIRRLPGQRGRKAPHDAIVNGSPC